MRSASGLTTIITVTRDVNGLLNDVTLACDALRRFAAGGCAVIEGHDGRA
jgi:hypothetical protein